LGGSLPRCRFFRFFATLPQFFRPCQPRLHTLPGWRRQTIRPVRVASRPALAYTEALGRAPWRGFRAISPWNRSGDRASGRPPQRRTRWRGVSKCC